MAERCSSEHIDRTPALVTTMMTTAMAIMRRRVRRPMPCGTSLPPDALRAQCACSASAPPPMATSATTPCPTVVPPTVMTTMVIGPLRRSRARASAPHPSCRPPVPPRLIARPDPRSSFTSPSPSAASARACPCADNDDHRNADDDGAPASTPRRIPSGTVGPACTGPVSTPGRSVCSAVEPASTIAVSAPRTIVRRAIGSACSIVFTRRRPAVSPADYGLVPAAIQKGWP